MPARLPDPASPPQVTARRWARCRAGALTRAVRTGFRAAQGPTAAASSVDLAVQDDRAADIAASEHTPANVIAFGHRYGAVSAQLLVASRP